MPATYPISGACQCGGVRYTLHGAPDSIIACHCRECQKLSTSAFSITAVVPTDRVTFEGEMADWSRSSASGRVNAAKFCPTCGNRIYHYDPGQPGKIKLKPSNLDDTSIIRPTIHVWTREKQDWVTIPDGVSVFATQP